MVVLEKVQAGLLGATLSSFGITGLYLTFVYGLGRFLRLSVSNLRLRVRIPQGPGFGVQGFGTVVTACV